MRKTSQKIRKLLVAIMAGFALTLAVATASATVGYINPQDASYEAQGENLSSTIPAELPQESKSRAPEPTTMALFGGGFLGMIMSFVRRTYAISKRALDILMSIFALVVLSPIMLLVAILVKLTSKGPIVYSQTRVGQKGDHFEIYKFRTMKIDAEKETGPVWAAQNDNRLTPAGHFLRKTHLDELPQFVNVLKGEMSIIGPRPERPHFVQEFKKIIPAYENRLTVKPGITGLAQVWYRYDETIADVKKKLKYDMLYIKKLCLWADVQIAMRTVRVIFTGEGAC